MSKVLFIYPNKEGYPIIPLSIAVLSGVLKEKGHQVELFDLTFKTNERIDHQARQKIGMVKEVDMKDYWNSEEEVDIKNELKKDIEIFNPDIIAFSIVETNYGCSKYLFKYIKEISDTPIIVGGLFPTICPDFFIEDGNVDIICRGEGEYALIELLDRLDSKKDLCGILNIIVKKNGEIYSEDKFYRYYDWNPPVMPDWELFDERHIMKPFMGRVWRTGFFELSRGCPFNCSYCINKICQDIFKDLGRYNRTKPLFHLIDEMEFFKNKYNLELIFFNDENFLTINKDRFDKFCSEYSSRINLPFFIMTRADGLILEDRIRMLKDCGCITIGIGLESGNEDVRKNILNKKISNKVYRETFSMCRKYQIRTTANVMIGLPDETEDNIIDTLNFCKEIRADSVSLSIFAPYYGTSLRDVCVEKNYMKDKYYSDISVHYTSILDMPKLSKEKIEYFYNNFNSIIYS